MSPKLPFSLRAVAFAAAVSAGVPLFAQSSGAPPAAPAGAQQPILPLDLTSMDAGANPCNDFYQYACGNFAKNHPIPADHAEIDTLGLLNDQVEAEVKTLLANAAQTTGNRTPDEQKIGDYNAACLDTTLIDQQDLKPVQPLIDEINSTGKLSLPALIGKLQRMGVNVFFGFGEMQDFKDASRQIATFDQGGLGLPEKDYYLRTGTKDVEIRRQYVEHITKMLSFGGDPPQLALRQGQAILAFETELAKASMSITEQRDPKNIYHPTALSAFTSQLGPLNFNAFLAAVHSPHFKDLNVGNPNYLPALMHAVLHTDTATLHAYMRYHLLTAFATELPATLRQENFNFYSKTLYGVPEMRPRWKTCANAVDGGLGEALGKVYVSKYFSPSTKADTLQLVHDIEGAMAQDVNDITWMSPATKTRALDKLHAIADKIGYPEHFRDYSALNISPTDAFGDLQRATEFENDRELNHIGKPVDRGEWGMSPSTVNAYYNPSMNDINFPAAILQPPFYDPEAGLPLNYGHAGMVIGHELTHGFDDQGRQFDGKGNLSDWWTPSDLTHFTARTSCVSKEYSNFTVGSGTDAVHVNGELTLGENVADNGGLVLATMALLDRARKSHYDLNAKVDGYDGMQRFYLAYAQNWCSNDREASLRQRALTDPHSPDRDRVNGVIVNQPGFAKAFSCKAGAPMVPQDACRVW